MKKILFWTFALILLFACQSKEEKEKDELNNALNTAWTLLSVAEGAQETELSVPFGFRLNCTEGEYQKRCDELIKEFGGERSNAFCYITADLLGTGKQELSISNFHYFSDPNTETDVVDKITFIFEESRKNWSQDLADDLIKAIDFKLTTGWNAVSFILDEKEHHRNNFRKYWVKDNMVIKFDSNNSYISLAFCNMPKYGILSFKDDVKMTLQIKEDVRKNIEEQNKLPKLENSVWDNSVWQVEKYLKKNLKDPKSYEGIEWSKVSKTDSGRFMVRHKYRAKNSFGGYVISDQVFMMDLNGNVIEVVDYE